jgi:hypothetical protein
VPGSSTELTIVRATDCLPPGAAAASPDAGASDRLSTPAH